MIELYGVGLLNLLFERVRRDRIESVPAVTVGCFFLSVNSLTFVIPSGAYYVRAGIILEMCWGEELHFCALCIVLSLPLCICWCLPWKKLLLFQCFVSGV